MVGILLHIAASSAFLAAHSAAPDLISGTWKGDVNSIRIEGAPSVYLLQDGVYSCGSCRPQQKVKADGEFHAIEGAGSYDELSVEATDARSIVLIRRKAGKVVGKETSVVSNDGSRLDFVYEIWRGGAADSVKESGSKKRSAPAPTGTHPISGSWVMDKVVDVSEEELTTSFRLDGDVLHMSSPSGESYEARLGGPEAPIKGSAGHSTVSVRRLDAHTYEEVVKRSGKIVGMTRMTLAADGRTMTVEWENKVHPARTKYLARKVD